MTPVDKNAGEPPREHRAEPEAVGLCGTCRHVRRVVSAKGSVFIYCTRSETDPAYSRYPRLPTIQCAGYERGHDP